MTQFFAFLDFYFLSFYLYTIKRKGWFKFLLQGQEIFIRDLEANLAKTLALVPLL